MDNGNGCYVDIDCDKLNSECGGYGYYCYWNDVDFWFEYIC